MSNDTKKETTGQVSLPTKALLSAENTDNEKTLAEDDQKDDSSGNVEQKFERVSLELKMVKGKKFGLGIILVHNRILVCKVDDDSMVSGVLKKGDQILTVDGAIVQDKAKCRKALMSGLNKNGTSALTLIRPKTKDALDAIVTEIQLSQMPSQDSLKPISPGHK